MNSKLIAVYKAHVDRGLLRENLRLTHQERFDKFDAFMRSVVDLQEAGMQLRGTQTQEPRTSR